MSLTSYDLFKVTALILMVIDHVGWIFFPDQMWFRVLGRLSIPIWFFLIGFAGGRPVPLSWLLCGALLVGSSMMAGEFVFPLDVLFTLAYARYIGAEMTLRAVRSNETLAGMFFLLVLLAFFTAGMTEYGTAGLLFTLWGGMTRLRYEGGEFLTRRAVWAYGAASGLFYAFMQGLYMPILSVPQFWIMLCGTWGVMILLIRFRPVSYETVSGKLPSAFIAVFHWCGRHTLVIYTVHLIAFEAAGIYLFPERFSFLHWQWLAPGLLKILLMS